MAIIEPIVRIAVTVMNRMLTLCALFFFPMGSMGQFISNYTLGPSLNPSNSSLGLHINAQNNLGNFFSGNISGLSLFNKKKEHALSASLNLLFSPTRNCNFYTLKTGPGIGLSNKHFRQETEKSLSPSPLYFSWLLENSLVFDNGLKLGLGIVFNRFSNGESNILFSFGLGKSKVSKCKRARKSNVVRGRF